MIDFSPPPLSTAVDEAGDKLSVPWVPWFQNLYSVVSGLMSSSSHLDRLSVAPASPTSGYVYYDTALTQLRMWSGSAWVSI